MYFMNWRTDFINQALNEALSGDISGALRRLAAAPDAPRAKKAKALCLIRLGYYKNALDYLEQADPLYDEAKKRLDVFCRQKPRLLKLIEESRYKEAAEVLREAEDISVLEHNILGSLYALRKDRDMAISEFNRALEMDKLNPVSVRLLQEAACIKSSFFKGFLNNIFRR